MEGLEIVPTIVSIVVVLFVLGATLFVLRWATTGRAGNVRRNRRSAPLVEIVERHAVGRNGALIVIRYGGEEHLLGVTDSSIGPIAEGTIDLRDPVEEPIESHRRVSVTGAIEALRNKSVRH